MNGEVKMFFLIKNQSTSHTYTHTHTHVHTHTDLTFVLDVSYTLTQHGRECNNTQIHTHSMVIQEHALGREFNELINASQQKHSIDPSRNATVGRGSWGVAPLHHPREACTGPDGTMEPNRCTCGCVRDTGHDKTTRRHVSKEVYLHSQS